MTRLLHVFRHGETDWNAELRMQGHTDIPLNAKGRAQAAALGQKLRGLNVETVYASDLGRSQETAQIVANALGAKVAVDPRLRETRLGEAEGLQLPEIIARYGEELWRRWRSLATEDLDVSFPGGETKGEALNRVRSALEEIAARTSDLEILVCSHGGVIRRLIHLAKPELVEPMWVANCEPFQFEVDPSAGVWRARF